MTDYNDGKWHGWNGGECPVHLESVVEYVWIDGDRTGIEMRKAGLDDEDKMPSWSHQLVAFRVIKPYREPREWWVDLFDMTVTKTPCHAASYYVKVREVIDND